MEGDFLTGHMASHMVAMNLLAPLLVLAVRRFPLRERLERGLAATTLCQMTLLWGWHMPVPLALAMHGGALMAAMHLSLLAAALWFWAGIIASVRRAEWQPLAALLITGKLVCLLGVLLLFASRPLYADMAHVEARPPAELMADQQLAGLLMLTACPLVYVSVAIFAACRWLSRVDGDGWLPAGGGGAG